MVKLGALLHTWKISKPTQILGVCLMKKPQFSVLVTERIPLHSFIRVHMECDAKNEASKRPLSLWNHKSRLLSDIQPRLISSTVLINSIALLTLSKVNAFVNMPQRSSSEHKRGRERKRAERVTIDVSQSIASLICTRKPWTFVCKLSGPSDEIIFFSRSFSFRFHSAIWPPYIRMCSHRLWSL